jgi:miniconductance mechanosensitive channel
MAMYIINLTCRKVLVPIIEKITRKTKSNWDNILLNKRVLSDFSRIIAPLIMLTALPHMFDKTSNIFFWCDKLINIYIVAAIVKLLFTIIDAFYQLSCHNNKLRSSAVKGIFQMFKIIAVCVGTIIIASIAIDKNPIHILTGLGAMAAVLMLVFQDTIKGLVAGIQLSANDMLRPGDWITMEKYGADGMVQDVSLTTVKVQNWDKTITTIPPYALVSESFQNWRGMFDSGGRRIKRSIFIDMNSVAFCTAEQAKSLADKGLITDIHDNMVNLTIFREWVEAWLKNHRKVNKGMTTMVRQLQPTAQGLPLELYFFFDGTAWVDYEHLQAEVFEFLLATLPQFGLKAFQSPTGNDLKGFAINEDTV